MSTERFEVQREIIATPAQVFALLCDLRGHVTIDSSGMLQSADGEPVGRAGDEFVVHMDREALPSSGISTVTGSSPQRPGPG